MQDHIRELLNRYHYSEEVKEAVAFRVLFGGEDAKQIMQELGIHSIQTIYHWVSSYQQKIEQGLISLPPMSEKQKQNLEALKQRNKDLEKALQEANLMILALHTMIDVAEKDFQLSIRKKSGTKRS
ncbi:transposase [Rhodocytophaga aerolata]|uniref:Transposase n=1 Tax=Rhodocytophaga aerolata TaxID=455078 RepID=A0ABT8RER0_9BACT|nr:transposase [Rhodocytophaga aerolata]MDO1450555.1 transposase [Rhodocytophaga aerolata]